MTHLKEFTASMEKVSQSDPMMQRWLYGTRDLERQLSERLVNLCRYLNMIPKELLASYADVLVEILESAEMEGTFSASSGDIEESLIKLSETLEKSEDPEIKQKGERIRKTVCK